LDNCLLLPVGAATLVGVTDRTARDGLAIRAVAHADHDAVAREVRSWYTSAVPEAGIDSSDHWFGSLCILGPERARLALTVGEPEEVPAALAAARSACGDRELLVMVEDRRQARQLDAALRSGGCQPDEATTYLALVGPMLARPGPAGLGIECVADEQALAVWARVRLQSFANSEESPADNDVAAEVAARQQEMSLASYQIGRLGDAGVSVLAYYPGADQLVFVLGTRMPYRHLGIAQAMLARWAEAGTAGGCRSLIINAHEGGQPAALYKQLGFTDEVYWYQRYRYAP
jgi:hypothetical protein